MAATEVKEEPGVDDLAQLATGVPGGVTTEELGTLYSAAKIEVRALNEQLAERDRLLSAWMILAGRLMEMLGVDTVEAIIPAVEKLSKNRQQRRSSKTPKTSSRQPKKEGR